MKIEEIASLRDRLVKAEKLQAVIKDAERKIKTVRLDTKRLQDGSIDFREVPDPIDWCLRFFAEMFGKEVTNQKIIELGEYFIHILQKRIDEAKAELERI